MLYTVVLCWVTSSVSAAVYVWRLCWIRSESSSNLHTPILPVQGCCWLHGCLIVQLASPQVWCVLYTVGIHALLYIVMCTVHGCTIPRAAGYPGLAYMAVLDITSCEGCEQYTFLGRLFVDHGGGLASEMSSFGFSLVHLDSLFTTRSSWLSDHKSRLIHLIRVGRVPHPPLTSPSFLAPYPRGSRSLRVTYPVSSRLASRMVVYWRSSTMGRSMG